MENVPTPITQADLLFQDADTLPSQLVYHVTQQPEAGHGTVVHTAQPTQPIQSFTQRDINHNLIVYRPPLLEGVHKEQQYTFKFVGKTANTVIVLLL